MVTTLSSDGANEDRDPREEQRERGGSEIALAHGTRAIAITDDPAAAKPVAVRSAAWELDVDLGFTQPEIQKRLGHFGR